MPGGIRHMNESPPFRPTRERPVPRLKPRGVWIDDGLDAFGNRRLVAVDSRHRIVCELPWLEGQTDEEIAEPLWAMLDRVDPDGECTSEPALRLA